MNSKDQEYCSNWGECTNHEKRDCALDGCKKGGLENYLLFREIQSNSFQDKDVFIEWLNKGFAITKL